MIEQIVKPEDFEKLKQDCATQAVEVRSMERYVNSRVKESKAYTDKALSSVLAAENAMERSVSWTRWTLGPFMGLIVILMAFFFNNLVSLSKDVSGLTQSVSGVTQSVGGLTQNLTALSEKVDKNEVAVSQQLMALQRAIERLEAKTESHR